MAGPDNSATDLLARLVAFDTTSHKSNLPLIRFVADYLAKHGVGCDLVPNADGAKASLFATIGPPTAGGIALSGHTDTVPVDAQSWDGDPFTLTERHERLHGRGTADMKAFLACVLAAIPEFTRRRLRTPIHLAFSYDEEIGCVGVRPMIAELGKRLPRPRLVIVGEPTLMAVVDAHKGPARWQVDVKGRAAHSSMAPLGVNAIAYAGRLIGELERIEKELARQPPNPRFDPPHSTLQVTTITGGSAANIVPAHCCFGFEVRALPGFDIAAIESRVTAFAHKHCTPEMNRTAPEAGINVTLVNHVPPFAADRSSDIVPLALQLAQQNGTHAVSYATEAGLFQDAGAASVVCGPGSIAQAHTANEWIAKSELTACMAFLGRLADWAEA